MKDACSEGCGGLAAPQTLRVFGAALIKAFILKSGCIRVQSCSISEFQNPDDLTCDTFDQFSHLKFGTNVSR